MKLPLSQIAGFTSATGQFNGDAVAQGYSIDSRTIAPGELFFAVKGERLDGHDYAEAALARGAVAVVVEKGRLADFPGRAGLMVVEDTLAALQQLATEVRRLWGNTVVGVTGSTGKTTTKEITARLLSSKMHVLKSEGNMNNHFGLPLQLLRLGPEYRVAVIEMGMSHPGEISDLARIAKPEMGVVTNVAPVHLGFFKSIADIAKAKQELIQSLPENGTAVLNVDDDYVSRFERDFAGRVVTYGLHHPADVRGENVEQLGANGSVFEIVCGDSREKAVLPLIGLHNVYNALAAVAVGLQYGVTLPEAVAVLATMTAADKRGQVLEIEGAIVINDCYNSNPRALDSMVDALAGMAPGRPGGRRILVAGEMLELGPATEDMHRRCGQHAAERKIDILIGVRGAAKAIVEGARAGSKSIEAKFVDSPEQAGEWLVKEIRAGDVVLLKASRGVKLERALEHWKERILAVGAE